MKNYARGIVVVLALGLIAGSTLPADAQGRPRPSAWADCELFGTVVAPAQFDPSSTPFDELYGGTSFKNVAP